MFALEEQPGILVLLSGPTQCRRTQRNRTTSRQLQEKVGGVAPAVLFSLGDWTCRYKRIPNIRGDA